MERARASLLVIVLAALAGCAADEPEPSYAVAGTFATSVSEAQRAELRGFVELRGGTFVLLESFPEQFRATSLDDASCEAVRTFSQARPYVESVDACEEERPVRAGDEPASNDPRRAPFTTTGARPA